MKTVAKRWMAWRNEGGWMPLVFALCALLSVVPGRAGAVELGPEWRGLTPAHFAALALLSAPDGDTAVSMATPQRAAMLLALCRQATATSIDSHAVLPAVSRQSATHSECGPIPSQATAHLAQRTQSFVIPLASRTQAILPSTHTLMAHEAALLSGVRTNRFLA